MADLDDFQRKLRQQHPRAQAFGRDHVLPLTEVLPDAFIRQYTEFQSLPELLEASGLDDPPDLDSESWSAFIAAHSCFPSWDEMLTQAMMDWTRR
jgi:hypothetical protein